MATLLFLGQLSDVSHTLEVDIPNNVTTTDELTSWLGENNPSLRVALERPGKRVAVNKTFIVSSCPINNTDEIAYMSPLSGG
jgi:molybdopterin converting factor small subunit